MALARTDEALLVKMPWSTRPFDATEKLTVPFFDFSSGEFTGEVADLDQNLFNLPLRRDIVHNVYEYFEHKGKVVTKRVKTMGDTAGSGKKPAPQKGRGAARIGNLRAP